MVQASRKSRRAFKFALALAMLLVALWLALPRLLGVAAERYLVNAGIFPGVSALRVDIASIDAKHGALREFAATYTTPGGDVVHFELHDVDIDYSLSARKASALRAKRGEIEVTRATAGGPGPWPTISWPQLPLESIRIDAMRLVLKPDAAAKREIVLAGSVQASASPERLQLEFRPATEPSSVLQFQATPQESAKLIALTAKWLPDGVAYPETQVEAGLQVASAPTEQPVKLHIKAPLASLARLAQSFGVALPDLAPKGYLQVEAEADLGRMSGSIETLAGDAELAGVAGTLPPLFSPLGQNTIATLAGNLHFAWQPSTTELVLQPGFHWQLNGEYEDKTKAEPQLKGEIAKAFALRRTAERVVSEGAFPLQLHSRALGQWQATLTALSAHLADANSTTDFDSAEAQFQIDGERGEWTQDALKLAAVNMKGKLDLHWSRQNGVRGNFALQAEPGRITWAGKSPIALLPSTWSLRGEATTGNKDTRLSTLTLKGEASSPALTIQPATGAALKTGAIRITLAPFQALQPLARSKANDVELKISARKLRYDNWPSVDLDTRLRLTAKSMRADGAFSDQAGAILQFDASQNTAESCGEARLSSTQALHEVDRRLQPRPAALLPLSLAAGRLDAQFALTWCAAAEQETSVNGHGTLKILDATLGWEKARIDALQTTLRIDSLQPPAGKLQVTAARGELATGTALSDLKLDLTLSEKQLDVQAFDLSLLGGQLHSEPVSLPWPLTEHTLPLEVRHLDLAQLLALLKVEGLSGSGQLNGRLPLTWQAGSVEIDNGLLESTGAGTLKYAPTIALPDNPGLLALRDFRYDQLRTHLQYAAGGAYRAQIRLEGHNPDFYNGYPIRFSLNVNGQLPNVFRAAAFSGDFNRHILEQLQSGNLQ